MRRPKKRTRFVLCGVAALVLAAGSYYLFTSELYYAGKIERALRAEAFPDQYSSGYQEILRIVHDRRVAARAIPGAALRCLQSEYRDRWGNYPVIDGAIQLLDDSDSAINALAALVRKNDGNVRLRHRAETALLVRLANLSDAAAHNVGPEPVSEEGRKERLAEFSRSLADLVVPLARGDDVEQRCFALQGLAGMQHPEAVSLAAAALKEPSPKRLRKAAFRAAWIFAAIKREISDRTLHEILIAALRTDDDELRRRILGDFTRRPRLALTEAFVLELCDDGDAGIAGCVLPLLYEIDRDKAVNRAREWLHDPDPSRRCFATNFLSEDVQALPVATLLDLCNSPVLSVRYSALRIARARMQHPPAHNSEDYQAVSERLRDDPNARLALTARWFAGDRSSWEEAGRTDEELYRECLGGRPPTEQAPPRTPTVEESRRKREAWVTVQKGIVAKARNLFPVPPGEPEVPLRRDLYTLLIGHYSEYLDEGLRVVCVPSIREKRGVTASGNALLMVTREELETLRDDYDYEGPVFTMSEIFCDAAAGEAWVSIGFHLGPKNGSCREVVLRRKNGIWSIDSERQSWVS